MKPPNFEQTVTEIVAADARYHPEAYFFMRDGIKFARRNLGRYEFQGRDFRTFQILDGLRRYALETYGPMAADVLAEWGVHSCEDFGEIISNMTARHCERGVTSGWPEDFKYCYTFDKAFRKPFLPKARRARPPKPMEVFPLNSPTE